MYVVFVVIRVLTKVYVVFVFIRVLTRGICGVCGYNSIN